ncbi:MAG: hypothetical protein WKG07_29105 [Hymenobacter sp.]
MQGRFWTCSPSRLTTPLPSSCRPPGHCRVVSGLAITLPGVTVNSTANSNLIVNNNTAADYVQDVTLDRLALTITDPAGQNFDFVKEHRHFGCFRRVRCQQSAAGLAQSRTPRARSTINLATPSGQKAGPVSARRQLHAFHHRGDDVS